MNELSAQRCIPCEGGVKPFDNAESETHLKALDNWQLSSDNKTITKSLSFKNYYETMAFVNAIAFIANQDNHHPDLTVQYSNVDILLTTHAIGGLSKNDFIVASKIDALKKV